MWVIMMSVKIITLVWCLTFSVDLASAGISCLSNPCLHGICIDDINSTYSCYCVDGYTGVLCQTNWDECWSDPCQNGGTCVDGIASYNCTCPDGFVGDNCETNYDECESNPCFNNGTCIDMTNGYMCSCVPGYSGEHCELDIAVCNSTAEERCGNGGHCIEGPGFKFYCQCLPGWAGAKCESPVDECDSNPCQNGGVCIDVHADYLCACAFGFTGKSCEVEIEFCNENSCSNNALCVVEDGLKVCYCVPDYHGERCELQYDECQLGPGCMNGGTCIDGVDNFTCSCPPKLTGTFCECLILDDNSTDCHYVAPTILPSTDATTIILIEDTTPADMITTKFQVTTQNNDFHLDITDRIGTTVDTIDTVTKMPTTEVTVYNFSDKPDKMDITTDLIETMSQEQITDPMVFENITSCKSCAAFTDGSLSETTTTMATTTATTMLSTTLQEEYITTTIREDFPVGTTIELPSVGTDVVVTLSKEGDLNLDLTTIELDKTTESMFTENPTDHVIDTSTRSTSASSSTSTSSSPGTSSSSGTSSSTSTTGSSGTSSSSTTKITVTVPTEEDIDLTTVETPLQSECSDAICNNHGNCYNSPQGARCQCHFNFTGKFCDENIKITTAAFTGSSYITHRILNTTSIKIKFDAKTLLEDGQIMFVDISKDVYMQLYMKTGLLKFKFSCGYQTMLLSELKTFVNNGFTLQIEARLDIDMNKQNCNATLHLNDTVAMSGGQVANITTLDPDMMLYLGNFPNNGSIEGKPFVGCISNLMVNGLLRAVFGEATEAVEISECSSLACLSGPCMNGGSCRDHKSSYICSCANGWMGNHCEKSICDHNPCQSGGSCLRYPGSGFLCMCPYGRHGIFCEFNIDITRPSLAPLGVESSYMIYPLAASSINSERFDLRLRFHTSEMDQIALLAFIGQKGRHDARSQHLAITFVKGYIMLTWNLGSGSRRIFTPRPLSERRGGHTLRVGRRGRTAWLSVDNRFNVSGNAPGMNPKMTTLPYIFIGGHPSSSFQDLPHDLPLHNGWNGCVWEIGGSAISSGKAIGGRGVGQCGVSQCTAKSCNSPRGVCVHSPATYGCICNEGWYGVTCADKMNPCDKSSSKCQGRCVISAGEPLCDCPYGRTGKYCEEELYPTDVLFTGVRSFIKLQPRLIASVSLSLEAEIKPEKARGIILYTETPHFYAALSIQGGVLEFRWTDSLSGVTSLVRSGVVLSMSQWHQTKAGRYGSRLYVWVDGAISTDSMMAHAYPHTSTNTSLLVGGAEDLSSLPFDAMSGPTESFAGCLRNLQINNVLVPLEKQNIEVARNVNDCDGTACGVETCGSGTCVLEQGLARCSCSENSALTTVPGTRCRRNTACRASICRPPSGICRKGSCVCAAGFAGQNCDEKINVTLPQFNGNSLIAIGRKTNQNVRVGEQRTQVETLKVAQNLVLNFTTATSDGLLIWANSIRNGNYIGIGLEDGYLKIVWYLENLRNQETWPDNNSTTVLRRTHAGFLSDAEWHYLDVKLVPNNMTWFVDGNLVFKNEDKDANVEFNDIYIGGVPDTGYDTAKQYFPTNFNGCIDISSNIETNDILSNVYSENIRSCQLFP